LLRELRLGKLFRSIRSERAEAAAPAIHLRQGFGGHGVSLARGLAGEAFRRELGQIVEFIFSSSAISGWPASKKRQLVQESSRLSSVS